MTDINFNKLFYSELYSNDIDDDNDIKDDDDNTSKKCNISNEIANDTYIELECKHGYNYEYIYNEIYKQKYVTNIKESVKLSKYQIKCPYCRNVQNSVLPGREGYQNIMYVNMPKKHRMKMNKCVYVFKGGKRKGQICNELCEQMFCNKCEILEKKRLERLHKSNKK